MKPGVEEAQEEAVAQHQPINKTCSPVPLSSWGGLGVRAGVDRTNFLVAIEQFVMVSVFCSPFQPAPCALPPRPNSTPSQDTPPSQVTPLSPGSFLSVRKGLVTPQPPTALPTTLGLKEKSYSLLSLL